MRACVWACASVTRGGRGLDGACGRLLLAASDVVEILRLHVIRQTPR